MRHRKRKNLFCMYCNKGFVFKHMMNKHIETHISKNNGKIGSQVPRSSITRKDEIPQKLKKTKCQCLNCSAVGGNKIKDSKGRLLHVCHYPDCGKVYGYIHVLNRHIASVHNDKKNFFCAYCNKGFLHEYMMKNHVVTCMNKKNCKIDDQVSQSSILRKDEILQKLKKTECQCLNCRVEGGNKIKGPNGKLQHACHYPNCGKVYGDTWHLKRHIAMHHNNERKFFCALCNKGFMFKYMVKIHLKRHMNKKNHENNGQVFQSLSTSKLQMPQKLRRRKSQSLNCSAEGGNKTKGPKSRQQHICDYSNCRKVYSTTLRLKRHVRIQHSKEKRFFCTYCNRRFQFKYMMKEHIESHMNKINRNIDGKASQSSDTPKRELPQKQTRTKCQCLNCRVDGGNRIKDPNGKLQHACHYPDCQKVYTKTWTLNVHIAMRHMDKRRFFCAYCNKGFVFKYMMKNHIVRHMNKMNRNIDGQKCPCLNCSVEGGNKIKGASGKLQHACHYSDCGKVYTETWNLKRHITMDHTNEKRFFCTYCSKGFAFRYIMEKHVKKNVCLKIKINNNNLDGQVSQSSIISDDSLMYTCRHCKRVFTTSADMESHLKWYSSKENFFCAHCPKGYVTKSALVRHVKEHMNTKSSELSNDEPHDDLYICPIPSCERFYTYIGLFKKHIDWHKNNSQLVDTQASSATTFELTCLNIERDEIAKDQNCSAEDGNKAK